MKIEILFGTLCLLLALSFSSVATTAPAFAANLSVISYNVESDDIEDTDPQKVAEDIQRIAGADLWGFSEVANRDAAAIFRDAVAYPGADFDSRLGTTGSNDKLQFVFNQNVLRLIDWDELDNSGGTRAPLFARFEFIPNGQQFLFTVNHFNRGDKEKRQKQAQTLRDWAERETLPIIAVGDYNFDFNPQTKSGNQAFEIFLEDDTFEWLEPQCLRNGNCPDTGTQCDPRYNSILDFVFVANEAKKWSADSQVLFLDEAVCSKEKEGYSDHRPVIANIELTRVTDAFEPPVSITDTIKIFSLLPNPMGDETQLEAVTLENTGEVEIDLSGWRLQDRAGNFWSLDSAGSLSPGENRAILRRGQGMALNNDGDTIELISPSDRVVDSVTYGSTSVDVPIVFR